MALKLTSPEVLSKSVTDYKLTAFAVDAERQEIHYTVTKIADDASEVDSITRTLSGPQWTQFWQRLTTLCQGGMNAGRATKRTLHEAAATQLSLNGTVIDED